MSWRCRCGPTRHRGYSVLTQGHASRPGDRRILAAGPSGHMPARATSQRAPGACTLHTWPGRALMTLRPRPGQPVLTPFRLARTPNLECNRAELSPSSSVVPPPSVPPAPVQRRPDAPSPSRGLFASTPLQTATTLHRRCQVHQLRRASFLDAAAGARRPLRLPGQPPQLHQMNLQGPCSHSPHPAGPTSSVGALPCADKCRVVKIGLN
jgi:hypothetical protein